LQELLHFLVPPKFRVDSEAIQHMSSQHNEAVPTVRPEAKEHGYTSETASLASSNYDEGKSTSAFVKVYCCRSPVELEALEHMGSQHKEGIPKVLLNLDHIKAKVETDMGSSKDMEWYNGCVWIPLTNIQVLVNYQRLTSFEFMRVVPIRVPSNYDECKSTSAFVKVYCCRSPVELETLEHMGSQHKEGIPKVLLNLDHIKAKVETDMGSSKDMEWYNGCVWIPLTNIQVLIKYQRLTSFEFMRVVPIRVPWNYDEGKSTSAFVKVYCCRSPVELETLLHMGSQRKDGIPKVLLNLDHIKAKVETDMGSSKDMEWHNGYVWKPLTNIQVLVDYQRLTSFEFMRVVPIRLPSSSGNGYLSPDIGAPALESVSALAIESAKYEIADSVVDQTVKAKVDDDGGDDAVSIGDQSIEAKVDDDDYDDETDSIMDQTAKVNVDDEDDTDSVVDQTFEVMVDDNDDETDSIMDQTVESKVNDDDEGDSIVDQTVEADDDDNDETWEDDASFLGNDWEVL
jgi:hypothetical protein